MEFDSKEQAEAYMDENKMFNPHISIEDLSLIDTTHEQL
jgi:viroplasmin and RNaseH domain-containing protein